MRAGGGSDPSSSSTSGKAADAAFPATVKGKYGDVTVAERPVRVVSAASLSDDPLLALGVQPVVTPSSSAKELYPWLRGKYTGKYDPSIIGADYRAQPETIAKWKPDLIIGDTYTIPKDAYAEFTKIAPTYLVPTFGDQVDVEGMVMDLATLTGTTARGKKVNAEIESSAAAAKKELACVAGKTYSSAFLSPNGREFVRSKVLPLDLLGLEPADDDSAGTGAKPTVSLENIGKLNGDVLSMGTWANKDTQSVLEADPRFKQLPSVANDAVLYVDEDNASAQNGPLGLLWQIDNLVDSLKKTKYCKG